MKKSLLSLIFYFVCLSVNAQASVLGIDFGKSYEYVKGILENRYGKYNVYENNGGLDVYKIKIGDYNLDIGTFEFQYNDANSYFYYASFQKIYKLNESSEAKKLRDDLASTIGRKYHGGYIWTNAQGYKCYSYALPNENPATNPICELTVQKGTSVSGDNFLYVILQYGPIHFIDESEDF